MLFSQVKPGDFFRRNYAVDIIYRKTYDQTNSGYCVSSGGDLVWFCAAGDLLPASKDDWDAATGRIHLPVASKADFLTNLTELQRNLFQSMVIAGISTYKTPIQAICDAKNALTRMG